MATHRKARTAILTAPRTAVGLTTAALATVTLLSETAGAAPASPAPQPSIAEVKAKVDALMHQAEVATETYNGAKEKTTAQNATVNRLLAQAAQKTQALNDSRRVLGQYAAAQYRSGGDDSTGRYLMASDPQDLMDQTHMADVLGKRQKSAVDSYRVQQAAATQQRIEAAKSLATLTTQQAQLRAAKADVQTKLGAAQKLLNSLTAQEKARLAALQAKQEEEARKKAAAIAAQEKARAAAAAAAAAAAKKSGTTAPTSPTVPANASVADKAIAFARAQIGEPYVWGATGPNSWDCSGLTQAAYRAAGVTLPRTTGEQVVVGSRVSQSDMQPGDLVFFYSDHSHVGIYIGGGEMIHAPHTGTVVKVAPITEMPIYGVVRPY
ncbi:NlpC/P60 family protein [Streptomyces cocklensis]|jgi:cell wall-associated NlpC family hydrolase|uniref:Cell wall-associated hydrolase, NlpC family n=1 Tax=Actinacidiphila cocklensis TaxID=887465 RepID=A0A9W4E1L0_9ACTN|nr:C40 family peptidase [Actinacidiphila cocklensis]MDD1060926.1 NlpC/P60 family protein [Actinacidiphila cocklensis]WSX77253.1 NlpC/P60 family protein [Streptomyces sp. NBC_00899]CAG6391580.1 Cell wall-associated hydrolase, NlpC family [Actinacidiphila cocklensis]